MKFSQIYQIISAHIKAGDTKTTFAVLGSPGCGKSALASALGADPEHGFEQVFDLNFSLMDIPDVAGLYYPGDGESLVFKANPQLLKLREGKNLLVIDEASDASVLMQNLARRIFWTREINGIKLSDQTHVVLLGNRVQDKSGANRFSGKVKNAVSTFVLESTLDDWITWAVGADIDPMVRAFLRFKPALLDKYDPDVDASPTPRQWELVSRVPASLPADLYAADVAAKVGDAAAAEYMAFRKMASQLVQPDEVLADPKGVAIPEELSSLYAIVESVAQHTTVENVEAFAQFVGRLPPAFQALYWTTAGKKCKAVLATAPFQQWAASNMNVIFG